MTLFSNKTFITLLFFGIHWCCFSQHIEVKGNIIDQSKLPINFATVQIEESKNHRLLGYGFSDEQGDFVVEADIKESTDISLVISFVGYTTYKHHIPLNKPRYNAGKIILSESSEALDEVVITAKPSVLVKNDTVQYSASAVKTKEDAVAEDLLKKLPGVSIDNDTGGIQVNGVDVTKILVNGEPFFSNNPKVAMKIISKEMIEKIEITNTKSDENKFTGNEDDEEAKTINIILKKQKKGSLFGNATAGLGTNNTYESNAVFNHMVNKSFFTVLAFSNNVNKDNFSYDDDTENTLDSDRDIKAESNVGINYSNKFKNNDKISSNYMFSDTKNVRGTHENRIGLVPSNPYTRISDTDQTTQQKSHKFDLKLTNDLFENFRLISQTNVYVKEKDLDRLFESETNNDEDNFVNSNQSQYHQSQSTQNLSASLSGVYKFTKLDSYINYSIKASQYNFNGNSTNQSTTLFSASDDVIRNQLIAQNRENNNIYHQLKYKQRFLEHNSISYQFKVDFEDKTANKTVADIDTDGINFIDNDALSFEQRLYVDKQEHKLSYDYRTKKSYFNFNTTRLTTVLGNKELNRDLELERTFKDYLISSKFRYKPNKHFTINANYSTKSIVPRNNELLTITDNTNPLNITLGNADLKRELEHLFSFNVRSYNTKSKLFFYNRISYTTVNDKIIDKTSVDEELVTTKTYINNSQNYKYSINGSISKDYKNAPLFYNFKMKWNASMGENTHLTNNLLFKSNFVTLSPAFYAEFNYNDFIEINPTYRLFLDNTKYNTTEVQNQSNIQHTFGLNITTFAPQRFTVFNQMQYNLNPKFEEGYGKQSLVWNVTANYSIVPNKAKLKLTVFNILNQYNNTNRRLTESRNSTYTYDVLKQYFMFSFKYTFKNT